jgi:UDP-N-acetylbacillosamine transaminase
VQSALGDHDIESRPLWKPLHLQPAFARLPATVDGTSEQLFAKGLCLPSGSTLTDDQVDLVAKLTDEAARSISPQ